MGQGRVVPENQYPKQPYMPCKARPLAYMTGKCATGT